MRRPTEAMMNGRQRDSDTTRRRPNEQRIWQQQTNPPFYIPGTPRPANERRRGTPLQEHGPRVRMKTETERSHASERERLSQTQVSPVRRSAQQADLMSSRG